MNINKLLKFSSDAGKLMLQSGGETYRVEETVSRICQSFDVDEVEVFASPTAVMISISFNGEIHSIVKRINSRGITKTFASLCFNFKSSISDSCILL